MAKGFVYIARNKAMPGLLKIGYTEKVPTSRIKELFTTGVPEPFVVAYYCLVEDAKKIEARIHQALSTDRQSNNREFFRVELGRAVQMIQSSCVPEHEWREEEPNSTSKREIGKIDVVSRHDVESELREMANFVKEVKEQGLEPYVVSLFYDSNSCCCNFELAEGVDEYSEIAEGLLSIARRTIGQFEWFGIVDHGKP